MPRNRLGLTTDETLQEVIENGLYSKKDVNYSEDNPHPPVVCGTCRFYLRDAKSEFGTCQVVEGKINWMGISDAYISAEEEAIASYEDYSEPRTMVDQMKRVKSRTYKGV